MQLNARVSDGFFVRSLFGYPQDYFQCSDRVQPGIFDIHFLKVA